MATQESTRELRARYYHWAEHPYALMDETIRQHVSQSSTVLDIGCGAEAPMLREFAPECRCGIGIDPVADVQVSENLRIMRGDACHIPLLDASVDLSYSRSVLEHLPDPLAAFREIRRVLRPGGRFVFLTPNLWDYGSLASAVIPNRLHPWIVRCTEGREERDTFPTHYRANTIGRLSKLATTTGFAVERLEHLGQYPAYLQFSSTLYRLGVAYERMTRHPRLAFLRGWIFGVLRCA